MKPVIKILIAEHDKHDVELINNELKGSGIDFVTEIVQTEVNYRKALEYFIPDIILCDYTFPSFDGPAAFNIREQVAPDTPFIIVSGTIGEENSIELIKNGVTDFVLKEKLFTLNTKLLRALREADEQKKKNKTEKELALNESKLARSQQLAKLGSWELNFDDSVLSLSTEGARIFGFPPTQNRLSYETWSSLVHPDDIDEVLHKLKQSRDSLQDTDYHHRILLKDGIVKHIYSESKFEFDESGKAVGLFGTMQDITESKKSAADLQKAYEEKNMVLESIDDGFFALDKNSLVTYWNRKAELLLDVKKQDILGKNLHEVFADSKSPVFYNNYQKALQEQSTIRFEGFSKRINRWFAVSAFGSGIGLSVYFKDVTEQKNDEEKLKESNELYKISEIRLKELNANLELQSKELAISNLELEQFAYVASHDLQEPLRMVSSFLKLLEKKYGAVIDDKGKQYIEFAVDGAKRMHQIILDLLEFSRVGKTEDKQERIELNELIDEIKILFRKQIIDKDAVIISDSLPSILGFRSPLRQVFQNLVSNALKYTARNRGAKINITCTELEHHWQFAVHDNGIGIENEYFNKIFIIFQRLHTNNEYSGTGMGLAITKKIIETHGGSIWVESEIGKGSIFYFTLLKN